MIAINVGIANYISNVHIGDYHENESINVITFKDYIILNSLCFLSF